jgi:hypothetical protein
MKIMKRLVLLFLFISLVGNTLAKCESEQINLNTASIEELDEIVYIGPATAIKIIEARPFDSLNDLINVSGIGQVKLDAIKNENLACVESLEKKKERSSIQKIEEEIPLEIDKINEEFPEERNSLSNNSEIERIPQTPQVIKLNSKDIKNDNSTRENKEGSLQTRYPWIGLGLLFIFLVILLFLKKRKIRLD